MKKLLIIIVALIVCALIVSVVWGFLQQSAATQPIPDQSAASTDTGSGTTALIEAASDTLGSYLTAATNSMSLYTYASDTPSTSTCTGTCATNWPPYTVTSGGNLTAATGITGVVSTITRDDGSLQVTYNGMPLYFYSKDVNAGDTTGDGVGGVWSIARP